MVGRLVTKLIAHLNSRWCRYVHRSSRSYGDTGGLKYVSAVLKLSWSFLSQQCCTSLCHISVHIFRITGGLPKYLARALQWASNFSRNKASFSLSDQTVAALKTGQIDTILRRIKLPNVGGTDGWETRYRFVLLLSVKIMAARRAGQMLTVCLISVLC